MVYSSIQWNINKNDGLELIHGSITKILKDHNYDIKLNDLVNELMILNVNIHNVKKYNNILKYIKCNYGGIKKFLDNYNIYGIMTKNNTIHVCLLNDNMTLFNRITRDDEWVLL